jgi:cysteinyl-tRNA synthetase
MFVCGPTVYDYIHIGNARTFVLFDVIAKYLRHTDNELLYIQNITDIDNKIIEKAHGSDKSAKDVAEEFEKEFHKDIERLGISSVDKYIKASDHIDEIIDQIKVLEEKGYAYTVPAILSPAAKMDKAINNSDVYFDVAKYEKDYPDQYGKLSGQNEQNLEEGVRVELESNKKAPRDFVLWKAQNYDYEPAWKSPWGQGRPGWHIEDTAISEKYLGQQYDIHGGGQDLMFPHHEAEIAQQQAASGKVPFVQHWIHSGFLVAKNEKMSKSTGNFKTAHELLDEYPAEALRLYLLSAHYRSPLSYSEKAVRQAEAGIMRIEEFMERMRFFEDKNPLAHKSDKEVIKALDGFSKKIQDAMDDDLNTPQVIAILFDIVKTFNNYIDAGKVDLHSTAHLMKMLDFYQDVMGIIPLKKYKLPKDIQKLADERQQAKDKKDFDTADKLREKILDSGYRIDDTPHGPLIKKK